MDWKAELKERTAKIDENLDRLLPRESEYPEIIFKAMRYSVFAGGKRLRPVFLLEVNHILGGKTEEAMDFACALEMIHTYSLIHDDLPALDNDNFRRGRLTNHKAFGENVAILAGDALLSHAFEVMANAAARFSDGRGIAAMQAIAHGAGVYGMVAGQVVDVINDGKKVDADTLRFIHTKKTGAMIEGAFLAGAALGGANDATKEILQQAATKIGLAFQIQDDILDVIGTVEELGKPLHSDEKNAKNTYVSLFGLEASEAEVERLTAQALEQLESFGSRSAFLQELTKHLVGRRK
ncbi:MAG TPA: polyprenyl synthetase family protein [Firmicutes bacterium]|nr:polyprenyl synthetase family protein [Bacillota bacterium]